MRKSRLTSISFLCSLVLHTALVLLLVFSFHFTPVPEPVTPVNVNLVKAATVDSKQVQAELDRLKEIDRQKQAAEKQKQEAMEKKLADIKKQSQQAEQKREQEEKRLADLKQKQEAEQKKREAEAKKLEDIKKQQAEAEKKRKEEAEAKAKADAARKQKEAEARRQAELQKQLAAEQQQKDAGVINAYTAQIRDAIQNQFNIAGLPPGLSCVLHIRMVPGGDVVSAQVVTSSGNDIFDRRAELAVSKASPLPVPDDPRLFETMRDINFTFAPNY